MTEQEDTPTHEKALNQVRRAVQLLADDLLSVDGALEAAERVRAASSLLDVGEELDTSDYIEGHRKAGRTSSEPSSAYPFYIGQALHELRAATALLDKRNPELPGARACLNAAARMLWSVENDPGVRAGISVWRHFRARRRSLH